jgi:hypothetical protein
MELVQQYPYSYAHMVLISTHQPVFLLSPVQAQHIIITFTLFFLQILEQNLLHEGGPILISRLSWSIHQDYFGASKDPSRLHRYQINGQ